MKTYPFVMRFRFGSTEYYEAPFYLTLSDEEIAFIKAFIKENTPDMPFWALDSENEEIFNRFMEAHTKAILDYVNKHFLEEGEAPYTEETVCWEDIWPEFDWPEQFLES